jgi:hypothetical protein
MTIVEETRGGLGADDKVLIGVISVVPSTGDVVYDQFSGQFTYERTKSHCLHQRRHLVEDRTRGDVYTRFTALFDALNSSY